MKKQNQAEETNNLDLSKIDFDKIKWVFIPQIYLDAEANQYSNIFESRELLLYALNSIQDGVSLLDTELRVRFVNTSMKHWYPHTVDIIGEKCYQVYHNRSSPCENCPILQAIANKSPCLGIVKYSMAGVDKGWQELFAIPIFDLKENILGVVEYVRDITFQYKLEHDLNDIMQRYETLEKRNEAISQLLAQRKKEREQLEETVAQNVEKFIRPSLNYLKIKTSANEVELVESLIEEIVYPITRQRSSAFEQLTARELQISALIKEGKTSKEIAEILCIAKKTVDYHRANIRRKLSLENTPGNPSNLRSYLVSHL
jgi:DNA-binding CsgD family transcriptional regulator